MLSIFILFYNIVRIPLLPLVAAAGFFNAKIRRTLWGRRRLFSNLRRELRSVPAHARRLWLHASSMGEFEQSIPLIIELADRFPNDWIIVSLFSPSVYDHLSWRHPRVIFTYLPLDGFFTSAKFIDLIKPAVHVIVRHDVWPNIQWRLRRRGIPSLLINGSISDKRYASIRRYKFAHRLLMDSFTAVCVVSEPNRERFKLVSPHAEIYLCGDTRYDRVHQRSMETSRIQFLLDSGCFLRSATCIAGSTWPSDEAVILEPLIERIRIQPDFKLILAPHEIDKEHLQDLENRFTAAGIPCTRLAELEQGRVDQFRVLLIDRIGILANLYALGAAAVVGGAFGPGVHSVLEPAAHGCVVCYGPRHRNSPEAKEMTAEGLGYPFESAEEFKRLLTLFFENPQECRERGERVKAFVHERLGAARRTADVVEKYLH